MKKVVVLQPQFLPWAGVFEQIKLADIYVHYDDVQFPLGRSFTSRVQIKTKDGIRWMTAPVLRNGVQKINEAYFDNTQDWKMIHKRSIEMAYGKSEHYKELKELIMEIYSVSETIAEFNICAIELICDYLGIKTTFYRSSNLNICGKSTERLVEIVKYFNGTDYITGHGAMNYLNYDLFEANNIKVSFMKYKCNEYTQMHGDFTPYVSIIDAIANLGKNAIDVINSGCIYWKDCVE